MPEDAPAGAEVLQERRAKGRAGLAGWPKPVLYSAELICFLVHWKLNGGLAVLRRAILVISLLSPCVALAQFNPAADQSPKPNPSVGANLLPPYNPLARPELWLSVACILFGLIVLLGQFVLLRKVQRFTSDDIVRNSTITIVVIGALVLIISGYDSQQTAQAFGLFGTIVGYMLGRTSNRDSQNNGTGTGGSDPGPPPPSAPHTGAPPSRPPSPGATGSGATGSSGTGAGATGAGAKASDVPPVR